MNSNEIYILLAACVGWFNVGVLCVGVRGFFNDTVHCLLHN